MISTETQSSTTEEVLCKTPIVSKFTKANVVQFIGIPIVLIWKSK